MKKFILLIILLLFSICLFAEDEFDPENDNIYVYSTWDANFLYLACHVDTPDVEAKNKTFNAPIGDDDGIKVVIDTSHSKSNKITSKCVAFSASAAGGFEFEKGTDSGIFMHENIFSHKIMASVIGSLNSKKDIDSGFDIEMALPWDKIGNEIPENENISFSYKVHVNGKEYCLTDIKKFNNPSSWYEMMVTRNSTIVAVTIQNTIICSAYLSTPPVVDGNIKDGEWNKKTRHNIKIPIDKSVYNINFQSQKVLCKELNFPKEYSFINSPKRVDNILKNIKNLEPVDVIKVNFDENLPQIIEALKTYYSEKEVILPVVPKFQAKDTDDLINQINNFLLVVPNQYRFIITDDSADRCLFIDTDLKEIDHTKLDSVFTGFKVSRATPYAIKDRIKSEYSYVITNYSSPQGLGFDNADQFNFIIKNVGSSTWKPLDLCLVYRWYKNDRFYCQGLAPIPITQEVNAGESLIFATSILPLNNNKKHLKDGPVILEVELVKNDGSKLLSSKSFMLKTSVANVNTTEGLKLISSFGTKIMALGHSYDAAFRFQNSTGKDIKKGDVIYANLAKVDKTGNIIENYQKNMCELHAMYDIDQGITGLFVGKVKFPKKLETPDFYDNYYALVLSEKDKKTYNNFFKEYIKFVKNDYNQKLLLASDVSNISRNKKATVKVIVRNAGEITWNGQSKLVANWYDKYGKMIDNGGITKISKKIKPGDSKMVEMDIMPPVKYGNCYLVITIMANDVVLSTQDGDRASDMIVVPVNVLNE